jgi:hypothetical protein
MSGLSIVHHRTKAGAGAACFSLAEGASVAGAYVQDALGRVRDRYPDLAGEFEVTYLDAGIMNYVYRVDFPGRTFFLKQALARVKQHERLGPDLAGVPPTRIRVEAQALGILVEALPPELRGRVPAVAWYDEANNVLWTEAVAAGAPSLQAELERGACDPAAAGELGRLLGAIHDVPAAPPLWGSSEEDRANWERFLRMRTTGFLERAGLPVEAEAAARDLFAEAARRERPGMVSHLDAAPKNVLLPADSPPVLLDFELGASISDPAYDPGFLAGHYLLMGENRPEMREAARASVAALVSGYRSQGPAAGSIPEEYGRICERKCGSLRNHLRTPTLPHSHTTSPGWEQRVVRYAALAMLYRIYGSSPASYLHPARFDAIRATGIRILLAGDIDSQGADDPR